MELKGIAEDAYNTLQPFIRCFNGVEAGKYYLIDTIDKFDIFYEEAKLQPMLAIDTETGGFSWWKNDVAGIVIGWGVANNYYLPINHKSGEKQLNLNDILDKLRLLLGNEDLDTLFWNKPFDLHFLRSCGIEVNGVRHDVMTMCHLLDENFGNGLKENSVKFINPKADLWEASVYKWRAGEAARRRKAFQDLVKAKYIDYKDDIDVLSAVSDYCKANPKAKAGIVLNKLAKEKAALALKDVPEAFNSLDDISYDYIPLDIMTPYACADVHYTWLLYKRFVLEIGQHADLRKLYIKETVLSDIAFEMEDYGLKIDRDYLVNIGPQLAEEANKVAAEIYADAGGEFNIDSDQELIGVFTKVGIKLSKLTKGSMELAKKGETENLQYSVDKDVLDSLASKFPIAEKILKYRSLTKTKGTYVDGILSKLDDNDFLHARFNLNVSTGRMSCHSPNIQNIPTRDKTIKRSFILPTNEFTLIYADASQVELRLTAHHSKDPTLLSCYPFDGPGQDVHSTTCAEIVLGITLEELATWKEDHTGHDLLNPSCMCKACLYEHYRNIAKRVNFCIVYGGGARTLQRQVSTPSRYVSEHDCQLYLDTYFRKYYGVKEWINVVGDFVRKHGYIQNSFGRYRRLDDVKNPIKWKVQKALRQGANFLIQGDAADLFKETVINVHNFLYSKKAKTKLINLVHDEISFYWHKEELNLLPEVKAIMEHHPKFDVPIIFEFSRSETNWADKKKIQIVKG